MYLSQRKTSFFLQFTCCWCWHFFAIFHWFIGRFGIRSSASWTGRWKSHGSFCTKQIVGSQATELGGKKMCVCVLHYFWGSWFCVPGQGQIVKAVCLHSCMSRGCWLANAYHTPLTRAYCLASENFTFSIRSPRKRMGSGTAWHVCALLKGRHLCWTCVRLRWWMDASEPKENTVLSSVVWTRSGRQMCVWETGTPLLNARLFDLEILYFCCSVREMSPSCGKVESPHIPFCLVCAVCVSKTLTSDSPIWPRSWNCPNIFIASIGLLLWHFNFHQ